MAERTCSIQGCERPRHGATWCHAHYRRHQKYGDPLALAQPSSRHHDLTLAERFWAKVDRSAGPDGCWPWLAGRNHQGYGRFRIGGRGSPTAHAHRVAWEVANGAIPAGLLACHQCDNPPCCNPSHLFLGTTPDNVADRDSKGRTASGERSGRSKHLDHDRIFALRAEGWSQERIAQAVGCSQTRVGQILRGG